MNTPKKTLDEIIDERFTELPQAVQDALTDVGVEQKLRVLSSSYKLHLDQWVLLENEIMLTLLGIEDPKNMAKNISKEVGIDDATAQKLVADIAVQIFKPIREQMQVTLDNESIQRTATASTVNLKKAKSAPSDTTAYKSGEKSSERREVQEDPYRESIE